jgi:hypothetical protein
MNDIVSTVLVQYAECTVANSVSGSPAKFLDMRSRQRASLARSVSRASMSASCSWTRSIWLIGTKLL